MSKLVINDTEITTDGDGRFSLNDLHVAAGGSPKHKPSQFLKIDSVVAVIEILSGSTNHFNPVSKIRGRYNGGTWVCKELVYKYAMWISPEFEVKVIQTFDSLMSGNFAPISMQDMNSLVKKIESDKDAASLCGKELAKYKKVKKENQEAFEAGVNSVQMALGFTNDGN